MKRIKKWILERFLPAYAKQIQAQTIAGYKKSIADLTAENERLRCYIAGLENGIKAVKKVQIINKGE